MGTFFEKKNSSRLKATRTHTTLNTNQLIESFFVFTTKMGKKDKKEKEVTCSPDDLVITPDELVFKLPKNPTALINLENKGSVRISFKVKGTAVERYSVRPNRGLVHPNSKDKISLTLKKVRDDEDFADRFMVQ